MFFTHDKKRRIWPYVVGGTFVCLVLLGVAGFFWLRTMSFGALLSSKFVQGQVREAFGEEGEGVFDVLPEVLGFTSPKTYLVLFLNNTELRPGGGFIGSYATVRIDRGRIQLLATEGSEVLDKRTPNEWRPTPPLPISQHLGVDRWYFRDSNWSPDFGVSSEQALLFYQNEGGIAGDEIDAVIGVTPTVLEELLAIIGPVTVDGITFSKETVTEQLQYETSYGFHDKNIAFIDRKQIIQPFFQAVVTKVKSDVLEHHRLYFDTALRMVKEKQILLSTTNDMLQSEFAQFDAYGQVLDTPHDYLLWVDANLAAWKTDHAMKRSLLYRIEKADADEYQAHVLMKYEHQGTFDWRTSRYRTYTRIFVPEGARLVEVIGNQRWDRSDDPGTVEQGVELGKQWFGTFIAIEPGQTKTLEFVYTLPPSVKQHIEAGTYQLLVQKQPGTIAHGLTLQLDFDKLLTDAKPAEVREKWGDYVYEVETDLRVDREFMVNF